MLESSVPSVIESITVRFWVEFNLLLLDTTHLLYSNHILLFVEIGFYEKDRKAERLLMLG